MHCASAGSTIGSDPVARVLGVDHGERRTGLAVSDPLGMIAKPHVEVRAGSEDEMVAAVAAEAAALEVAAIVVGLPLNMDGTEGPRAASVRAFVERLRDAVAPVDVALRDERLTSADAASRLRAQGRHRDAADKTAVNLVAASIVLQEHLDDA